MTGLVTTAALVLALGAGGDTRFAVRYDLGAMGRAAQTHGIPVTDCMFAHPILPLGTRARIRGMRTGHEEICVQGDTSQDRDTTGRNSAESDRARHIRLKRVELSYSASFRICGAGWEGAAVECEIRMWVLPE